MTLALKQTFIKTITLGIFVLPLSEANAFNMFDEFSNCTRINCQSIRINGSILIDSPDRPSILPWVAQVFGLLGNCIRLDVSRQTEDLDMVVVSPDGRIWRDSRDPLPLIKIQNAPADGWYTVHLSHSSGVVLQNFTLNYGRYPADNPNCANPTEELFFSQSVEPLEMGEGASGPPFRAGSPGHGR